MDRVQRRIAAILAADVVGYSRLIGNDGEATLATLRLYPSLIDGLIAQHNCRVFDSAGDSVVAEFASPVDAVRCATDFQLGIDKRNADLPEASRMRFRIGINLGDVVVDGDNLMGDGVNIAARLEALSQPGGIDEFADDTPVATHLKSSVTPTGISRGTAPARFIPLS